MNWSLRFFAISVWYAILIDLPITLEDLLTVNGKFYPFKIQSPDQWKVANFHWFRELKPLYVFLHNINTSYQVPWHKLGKDIFLLLAVSCAIIILVRNRWMFSQRKSTSPICLTFINLIGLIGILGVISLARNGVWTAAVGLRAHLPLLAFSIGLLLTKSDLEKMWLWLRQLLMIQFVFAVLQRWVQVYIQISYDGQRSPGTFIQINSLSLFIVVLLVLLLYLGLSRRDRWTYVVILLVLAILTRSRMAILMCLVVVVVYGYAQLRSERLRKALLLGSVLLIPIVPLVLGILTGRHNVIRNFFELRGSGPLEYMMSSSLLEMFIGEGLGRGATLLYTVEAVTGITPVPHYDTVCQ